MSLKIYSLEHNNLSPEISKELVALYVQNQARSTYKLKQSTDPLFLSSKADYIILQQAGQISAYLIYKTMADEVCEIWQVIVSPKYWGQGLADAILKFFYENLPHPAQGASLEVSLNNLPAIALYKRNHWQVTRSIKNYYSDGSDALVMHLKK